MLNYKGYIGHVEFDDEAEIFAGEVINTKDVITFHDFLERGSIELTAQAGIKIFDEIVSKASCTFTSFTLIVTFGKVLQNVKSTDEK